MSFKSPLMVVGDFDIEWPIAILWPFEADPPLLIDSNAELTFAIAAQRFKTIAGQQHQILSSHRDLEDVQPSFRLFPEGLKLSDVLTRGKPFRSLIPVFRRGLFHPTLGHG